MNLNKLNTTHQKYLICILLVLLVLSNIVNYIFITVYSTKTCYQKANKWNSSNAFIVEIKNNTHNVEWRFYQANNSLDTASIKYKQIINSDNSITLIPIENLNEFNVISTTQLDNTATINKKENKNSLRSPSLYAQQLVFSINLTSTSLISTTLYGSTLTICNDINELENSRCFTNINLLYSYYGTGHVIFNGYMYYHRDNDRYIVKQSIDSQLDHEIIQVPNDALCCSPHDHLFKFKQSGFFKFTVDENGLWFIYRQDPIFSFSEDDIYVITKIDELIQIEKRWFIKKKRSSVSNMFVNCGKLFEFKSVTNNQGEINEICDLITRDSCDDYDHKSHKIITSSSQITSVTYNPSKNEIYTLDGGTFYSYKIIQKNKLQI